MAEMFDTKGMTFSDNVFRPQTPTPLAGDERISVMSPEYRPRAALGGQELLGLGGAIAGGIAGAPLGPGGMIAGSALGAQAGGAAGELLEQTLRKEPVSVPRISEAGIEEAAWDLGGNLVLKGLGKVIRFGSDALGFTNKDVPDATKAAQRFLEQYGSSLPVAKRTGSNVISAIEQYTNTPITRGLFEAKQQEMNDALMKGSTDILKSLVKSPEFDYALRTNVSSQRASGEILQNFIREGQDQLSRSVEPIYKQIFSDVDSKVSTFGIKRWADEQLKQPAALTAGQRSILNEIKNIPNSMDIPTLHNIRSRFLAENRDKYASAVASEKDSRASDTITALVDQLDKAMDFSAKQLVLNNRLNPQTYKQYLDVTKTYREGIQGLKTESIVQALAKNPEEVGSYLFKAGNETPVLDLYKSVASAGALTKQPSSKVLDALRYGYIESMINSPDGIVKLADELGKKGSRVKNTYDILMANTPQDKAIKDMAAAAKAGDLGFRSSAGLQMQAATALRGALVPTAVIGTGYYFSLTPEQQEKVREQLGSAAIVGGSIVLSQRMLAKAVLDPKGARAVSLLSKAKNAAISPSGFTKLAVEPLVNIFSQEQMPGAQVQKDQFDTSGFTFK
jgi:hypothetical protein